MRILVRPITVSKLTAPATGAVRMTSATPLCVAAGETSRSATTAWHAVSEAASSDCVGALFVDVRQPQIYSNRLQNHIGIVNDGT